MNAPGNPRVAEALADRSTQLRPAPAAALARLQLTAEEGFLLSRLDRPMKLSELLVVAGLPEMRARQVLEALVRKGAVLLPGEPVRAAPAVARAPRPESPWGDYVFLPHELAEDVDLEPEKKKLVLFLFANLDTISYFRLLGVDPKASVADVRRAYLERSKQFHPDTYFRARLGSYAPKMTAIFQRLKLAHDTLVDEEARRKYERDASKNFSADEQSAVIGREIEQLEEEKRQKSRRERLMHAKGFARLTRSRELVLEGDKALVEGDIANAVAAYQLASEMDPRFDEARQKLIEARRVGLARRADLALEESRKFEAEGMLDRALELLKSATEFDPQNGRVHLALASLLLRTDRDPRDARGHAQKAVDLGEKGAGARLVLGEALLRCGLKKNARRELEAAEEAGESRASALLKQC